MTGPSLRTLIRSYYETSEPSPAVMTRLRTLAEGRPARWWLAAAVVCGALALGATAVLLSLPSGDAPTPTVAREIAWNHLKNEELEFRTASYAEIVVRLPDLGFTVVPPRPPLVEGLQLVGGRLCALQGCPAAQIRLVRPNARMCTLYEVKDGAAFEGVAEGSFDVDGICVHIWRQDGLLFGLAAATE